MAILPSNNISIMLVRNTLGYPSTDLGTLCSCDKINKWSKKKPVNYNFTFNRPTDWYKGSTGNYGLNIPTITLDLIGNSIITYDKPKGGETSPYRLGDFAGYFHNAPNAVEFSYPDKLYSNSGSANFYLLMNFDNTNAVTLRDIFNLDSAD